MSDYHVNVYERSGSPFWWARCYVAGEGGRERRWSTGIRLDAQGHRRKSRRLAQGRAEEQARRLADQVLAASASDADTALKAVARRMLRQKLADGRRDRAVAALQHNLDKHVLPYFGERRDVRTIRRPDLEAFKRELVSQGRAPVSVNNALTAIRQVLKQAANVEELLEVLPHVANVRVPTEGKGRALTNDQVQALLDAIDPRAVEARQFLAFVANTGLRKSEALAMRWGWVSGSVMRIPAEHRKGGAPLSVPLNDEALAILEDRRQNGTKYTGSRKRPLPTGPDARVWIQVKHDEARNSAAERAGLGGVRTHDLRHTYGARLYAEGASVPEVRDLLGHKTMAMANRYAHAYEDRLLAAAQRARISVRGSVRGEGAVVRGKGSVSARSRKRDGA